jgi:hypothetical protein
MTRTENYGFNLIDGSDNAQPFPFNENFEEIDRVLNEHEKKFENFEIDVDGEVSGVKRSVEEITGAFDKSINLYNVSSNHKGYKLDRTTGEIYSSSVDSVSDFIFLEAGTTYCFAGFSNLADGTTQFVSFMCKYYLDKSFRTTIGSVPSTYYNEYDCYVRLSGNTKAMQYIVVSKGETAPTDYVPYKNEIKPEYIPVDKTFNPESELAQSGKAVAQAISGVEITTDSTVTENSTNPVTSGAVYNALRDVGISQQAKTLLIKILTNSIYANDQSENIYNLELELLNHSEPDTPDNPDEPDNPDVPDDVEDVWTYDKFLSTKNPGTITDDSEWLVTPFIPITPDVVDTVIQAQANTEQNTVPNVVLAYFYKQDENYFDYSTTKNAETVSTINGHDVYKKTLVLSSITGEAFIRLNVRKDAYQYCKVWQNGELLFDGSQYPPTK